MTDTDEPAPKLKKAEVLPLFEELEAIRNWLNPPIPDPPASGMEYDEWLPLGYFVHPENPEVIIRYTNRVELWKEVFGDPERKEYEKQASQRIAEIEKLLAPYFFPRKAPEGQERVTKDGFIVGMKTIINRKFDLPVLATVTEECGKLAAKMGVELKLEDPDTGVIKWEPGLNLPAYRNLPPKIKKLFSQALIETPGKPVFEIMREVV